MPQIPARTRRPDLPPSATNGRRLLLRAQRRLRLDRGMATAERCPQDKREGRQTPPGHPCATPPWHRREDPKAEGRASATSQSVNASGVLNVITAPLAC